MTWSGFIAKDLRARIVQGLESPQPLTLHGLARHYRVSISPVQIAIDELVSEGYLKKTPAGRLRAEPISDALRALAPELETPEPPRDFYRIISEDLVGLSLQGRGDFLREKQTARKYGLSGTRLRQIFSRLAGEGIIEHVPRQGWRIHPFRQEDMDAFVQVREAMELLALDLAKSSFTREELIRLRDANIRDPQEPFADESLHQELIDRSGNGYIREFFSRQGAYFRMLAKWESQDRASRLEAAQQHWDILDAMARGKWALAKTRLSFHIRENYPILKKLRHSAE
jgi:DNA-binding GntR family transcriptional regulator